MPGSRSTVDAFVSVGDSTLKGLEDQKLGVKKFFGVPYALPPTGDNRFMKPRPLPETYRYGEGTLDCSSFRAICPQPVYLLNSKPMSRPPKSMFSEDCLYLNIWMPTGRPPGNGWPVMIWIHGGWYQIGNPLQGPDNDPSELISSEGAGLQALVVAIGYRLNLFGFLAGEGIQGNFGLWDQRCALEWVNKNISSFGGDSKNVTIAGLSAGANSVHHQINHEFFHAKGEPVFHRAIMFSNAISSQPKPPEAAQEQFVELCQAFDLPQELSKEGKLARLRSLDDNELADKILDLKYHTFRCVTDDDFISPELIRRAQNGAFAAEFHKRQFKLIIGEVENEETVYAAINAPTHRDAFLPELENYYSKHTASELLSHYPLPEEQDENDPQAWRNHFGALVAAAQVRASTRALVSQLLHPSAGLSTDSVLRYRISLRLQLLSDLGTPESFGVGHGMDQAIWWFQQRLGYRAHEETSVRSWLSPFLDFIRGNIGTVKWGTTHLLQYRQLHHDGTIGVQDDRDWKEYQKFANILIPPVTEVKL